MNIHTLVFATNNPHKAREVGLILGDGFSVKTLRDIGCFEEIEETEPTLEGNALLKARYVKEKYGYDCFSEDAGLEVEALGGAPGVHTARYAGEAKDPNANMALLLKNLEGHENRRARFRAVIALITDGREILLEGVCPGRIASEKRGSGGFGYDPLFQPADCTVTAAELALADKNRLSHRGRALAALHAALAAGAR